LSAYGLGLGLGMTAIVAAVSRGQTVDVVPVGGDTTSPAAPALAYAANDKFATGTEAERRGIGSPDRLVTGVLAHVADGSPVVIGASTYPADVVLATMVQAVLTTVEAEQGGDPAQLTITYPTHWSDDQITALAEALRPAAPGGVLRRIPNAVAIAVDYLAGHPLADGAAVGVVDVGATSFEAAVVGRRGGELVLLSQQAEHGTIGGDQFDDAVLQYVDRSIGGAVTDLKEVSGLQAQIALARLRRDCREAKEALSTDKSATLTAYLPSGPAKVTLTRAGFEDTIRAQAQAVADAVAGVMGSVAGPLQAIVLTGGCAQIPLLQRLLGRTAAGQLEVVPYAAARGAALLAAPEADPAASS
jgi:molecular chaperone DnaK